jgi:tetratricopeptide (TPR) repeat protein
MTLSFDRLPLKLAAAALTFAALFVALRSIDGSPGPAAPGTVGIAARDGALPGATTDERLAALQEQVRTAPSDPEGYAALGAAYLQKVRESGDPSYYSRAEGVLRQALRIDPRNFNATSALGTLALARPDFAGALALGERARRINPTIARNYGVIADAQIELGRYAAARETLQRWVNLEPGLSSYARVSYFRELHGDLAGALAAMRLAASAGGDTPESFSYVQTLVGNLLFESGRYAAAERAYRSVLATDAGYGPAQAGLARLGAGRGDLDAAIDRYRGVVRRLPLPEYVISLAEAEQAAGRVKAARRDYALVQVESRLLSASGVDTDVDLALFEANHGDPGEAVALARSAWRAAPSVRSADALAWALSRAGRDDAALRHSRAALRLGSRDPSFLFHAGVIAYRAGRDADARAQLGELLSQSPRFSPLYAPRARRILGALR